MTSSEPKAGTPLVTIGIPTFNRLGSLKVALGSAQAQTWPSLEILVSDNASTDGTSDYLRAEAESDDRIRLLLNETNRGATANFQAVLAEARGTHFMWLADDDEIEAPYVQRCMAAINGDPDVALAAGTARYLRDGAFERTERPLQLTDPDPVRRLSSYARLVNRNETFYGIARTDHWREFIPMRNTIAEDWSMVAGLAARGKVMTLPDVHLTRRVAGYGATWATARSLGHSRFAALLARPMGVVAVVGDVMKHPAFDVLPSAPRRSAAARMAFHLSVAAVRSTILSMGAALLGARRWEALRRRAGRSAPGSG